MTCDICRDSQRIRLPTYAELAVAQFDDVTAETIDPGWKEFPCPQCVPMVPYRRVRAVKVATGFPPEEFAKFQVPFERKLAAQFGEFLLRDGLLRFTTDSMENFTKRTVTVTAHLNVVSREDAKKARAAQEVAIVPAPPLPKKLSRQALERVTGLSKRDRVAVTWTPEPFEGEASEFMAELEEPKTALDNRFQGLEL